MRLRKGKPDHFGKVFGDGCVAVCPESSAGHRWKFRCQCGEYFVRELSWFEKWKKCPACLHREGHLVPWHYKRTKAELVGMEVAGFKILKVTGSRRVCTLQCVRCGAAAPPRSYNVLAVLGYQRKRDTIKRCQECRTLEILFDGRLRVHRGDLKHIFGLSWTVVRRRMSVDKLSIEEALTLPLGSASSDSS